MKAMTWMVLVALSVMAMGRWAPETQGSELNQTATTGPVPRFTIQVDTNCVVDNLTGLMWARNANLPGTNLSWSAAVAFCENLNYGGHTDWRLPHFNDLVSLIDKRYSRPSLSNTAGTGKWAPHDPFKNIPEFDSRGICYYWASTTTAGKPAGAWLMSMFYSAGSIGSDAQETGLGYVWPVRTAK